MNDILKELDIIFNLVSSIPVTGDSVDKVFMARQKLRGVYANIQSINEKKGEDEDLCEP